MLIEQVPYGVYLGAELGEPKQNNVKTVIEADLNFVKVTSNIAQDT